MTRETYLQSRVKRWLQTVLYFGAVGGLLLLSAWLVFGPSAMIWLGALGAAVVLLAAKVPPSVILGRQGARPLRRYEAPDLHEMLAEIGRRAELPRAPDLYFIPSLMPQAFAVSSGDRSAITVTEGLLRMLSPAELAGVLAHETSHLKNGDTRLLMAARWMAQITRSLTTMGFILAFASALLLPEPLASPLTLLVLLVAPPLSALALLALSRTREFDADVSAAGITGNPEALASGLMKLQAHERKLWRVLLPFPVPEPNIPQAWRTHPDTRERVERLLELTPRHRSPPGPPRRPKHPPRDVFVH